MTVNRIDEYLIKGKEYVRKEIHQNWGGRNDTGISVSKKYNYIFLFTPDNKKHWRYENDEEVFYYSSHEDHSVEKRFTGGNKAVFNHEYTGKRIFLFESVKRGIVKFIDEMVYIGQHRMLTNDNRDITVFELKRKKNKISTINLKQNTEERAQIEAEQDRLIEEEEFWNEVRRKEEKELENEQWLEEQKWEDAKARQDRLMEEKELENEQWLEEQKWEDAKARQDRLMEEKELENEQWLEEQKWEDAKARQDRLMEEEEEFWNEVRRKEEQEQEDERRRKELVEEFGWRDEAEWLENSMREDLMGDIQIEKGNPQGKDAQSDGITETDLLGRDILVKELSDFYTEYTDSNQSSFYLGIFARWGMGKSSILQMLSNAIRERKSEKNEYLVCKVDCSVFDKKDQLWIRILNQLIDEISKDGKNTFNFKWKFISFKTRFFARNFWEWLKGKNRWINILGIGSIFGFIIYKFMPLLMGENQNLREITFLITIVTACYTLVKSMSSIFKENVFLTDNRSIDNTYSRSINEYRLLLNLLNDVPKKKDIKILLILDELDRIHKDLLPDIIECIQLFKSLNEERVLEKREYNNNEMNNKSTISCIFSFNHDVLFPIIGRNISLEDKQLFIQSYKNYKGFVEGKDEDAYIDYYKLGKEYMDKYLDLSLYLEDSIDYRNLVDHLFDGNDIKRDNQGTNKASTRLFEGHEELEAEEILRQFGNQEEFEGAETKEQSEYQEELEVSEEQDAPSFTLTERQVIKDTICMYAADVEPRKIIRLKNALILLKKLNKLNEEQEDVIDIEKKKELQKFIINFLEIDISDKNAEIAATVEELPDNKYLKYTNYFIHNKD
ncbi:P-loop NTPase fold protein [Bacillus wiedmannii]|uniref:P-loop NTPase fold protein n=1 Tax=Bacillus wiedmannii TaxID=1890302 RepID=UPI0035DD8668